MPAIRIVNWNIQTLGPDKLATPGMMQRLGTVIARTAADVAIILEVNAGTGQAVMTALSAAANAASVALGGAATDYTGWLLSYQTGGECYGVLFRDLNTVRPIEVTAGPSGAARPANPNNPQDPDEALTNLDFNQFATWPGTFAAMPDAYPGLPGPAARPRLPLTDVFAGAAPAGRNRERFYGRTLADGGFALGRGFRMPCLLMLSVTNGGGPVGAFHLIPVVACHLGAVRSGANTLARGQIMQYKDTHIAQKFRKFNDSGYICLDGAAVAIQELVITGDFNVDFLENDTGPGTTALQQGNREALDYLTPTVQGDGSAVPPAPPALPNNPGLPPPGVPFGAPFADGPVRTNIPKLALRAGETANGTILAQPGDQVPPPPPPYVTACLDNFFYGGTQLSATVQLLNFADACEIFDVPNLIAHPGVPGGMDIGPIWNHYINLAPYWYHGVQKFHQKTLWAASAFNLDPAAVVPPALTAADRLVAARFLSDHLPTILQANLP